MIRLPTKIGYWGELTLQPPQGGPEGANTPKIGQNDPNVIFLFEKTPHRNFDFSIDFNQKLCEFLISVNSQTERFNILEKRANKVRAQKVNFQLCQKWSDFAHIWCVKSTHQ